MKLGRKKPFGRRSSATEARELIIECETFLNGHYLSRFSREGAPLPPWAWLNTLAHGERGDLEALAEGKLGLCGDVRAAEFFAGEVLATADGHRLSLKALQREVLIPAELRYGTAGSAQAVKELCSSLLVELKRAGTMAERSLERPRASGPPNRPDASP